MAFLNQSFIKLNIKNSSLKSPSFVQNKFFATSTAPNVPSSPREKFALSHITPGIGRLTNLEIVSGKGSYITDVTGKSFLDYTSGIAVTSLGHCHPKVNQAIKDQVDKIVHAQVNIFWHKPMLDLIERLLPIAPKGLDGFFFWNSGSEAVEASIKLARYTTKKSNVIVFDGGYHGRTFATMGMTTSKSIYREGFGPFMPGVHIAPFPACIYCHVPRNIDYCCNEPLESLNLLLKRQSTPSETAAIVIEPILGEGGYIPPPKGFLPALRELCTKNNILLVFDEVQSGMGRTGTWWAANDENVVPDILIFAKGIANGLPLSGIMSSWQLMGKQPPGSMGGTYAGNAVACAAASAVIDVMKEEKILDNVLARGNELIKGLNKIEQIYSHLIKDVRGRGLMIGVEFDRKATGIASEVVKVCVENGMLLLTCGGFEVVRFMPPLNTTKEEVQKALSIFEKAVGQVEKKYTTLSAEYTQKVGT